jgi:hypothetical protein
MSTQETCDLCEEIESLHKCSGCSGTYCEEHWGDAVIDSGWCYGCWEGYGDQ